MLTDRVYVGYLTTDQKWAGSVFAFDFINAFGDNSKLPKAGDTYRITFKRPFFATDTISFTVVAYDSLDKQGLKNSMQNIRVVPNPYVATNAMEPSVANWYLNQRRRLLFTNLPAECTIRIYTVSGVLVDVIEVHNPTDNGTAHWDMLTKENLEIAAGMYIYHVQSRYTKDEKVGKFAVIK